MRLSFLALVMVILASLGPCLAADLTQDQLKLLHDPAGWEYTAILDRDNGISMTHQCFVEGQEKQECRGTLMLGDDGTFRQKVIVHERAAPRQGTYELVGDQITFKDELGTKDGPYTLEVDTEKKSMRFSMRQAGVLVGADLLSESEYRKSKAAKNGDKSN